MKTLRIILNVLSVVIVFASVVAVLIAVLLTGSVDRLAANVLQQQYVMLMVLYHLGLALCGFSFARYLRTVA